MGEQPSATLEDAKRAFAEAFVTLIWPETGPQPPVGTIEGGDETPAMIQEMIASDETDAAWKAGYGCGPEEEAILIEWVPATLWPRAKTADGSPVAEGLAVPRERWLTFPKRYMGYPVYYRQGGAMAVAETGATAT